MKALIALLVLMAVVTPLHAQQTGWIGVSVEDGSTQGATIQRVDSGSPAEKAGLKSGDLVVEFNKTPVLGSMQLTRLIRETPPGRTVEIKLRRDNRDQTMSITTTATAGGDTFRILDGRALRIPSNGDFIFDRLDNLRADMPQIRMLTYGQLGMRVDDMTTQLRGFFGVNGNNGVLVVSVDSGSIADKAGLKVGDVITAVDNQFVHTASEFSREIRRGSTRVTLKIVRDKKEQDITVERGTLSR